MNNLERPINIIGISTVTSNAAAFQHNTIAKLWNEFLSTPIKEQLTDITSSSIFAVYTDYENGYEGNYKLTIGYAITDTQHIPKGLTVTTIPAGKYQAFPSKSQAPEDIVNTWKTIWQIAPTILQPNFVATFEEYKDNNEVIIHIGHE